MSSESERWAEKMKQEFIMHSEENGLRTRLFTVCFIASLLEVLILSPLGLGERFELVLLGFALVPIGFGACWLVLIVQFYNPICPKILLKCACLFFFYGCLLTVVLSCLAGPFMRFLGPEPMDAMGMSLTIPANIGGSLGALWMLKRTELRLNMMKPNHTPDGIRQPVAGSPNPSV